MFTNCIFSVLFQTPFLCLVCDILWICFVLVERQFLAVECKQSMEIYCDLGGQALLENSVLHLEFKLTLTTENGFLNIAQI